jgi:hypothetical protein
MKYKNGFIHTTYDSVKRAWEVKVQKGNGQTAPCKSIRGAKTAITKAGR